MLCPNTPHPILFMCAEGEETGKIHSKNAWHSRTQLHLLSNSGNPCHTCFLLSGRSPQCLHAGTGQVLTAILAWTIHTHVYIYRYFLIGVISSHDMGHALMLPHIPSRFTTSKPQHNGCRKRPRTLHCSSHDLRNFPRSLSRLCRTATNAPKHSWISPSGNKLCLSISPLPGQRSPHKTNTGHSHIDQGGQTGLQICPHRQKAL